jgi:hypothetical protein
MSGPQFTFDSMKFISDIKWLSLITETYLEGLDAHKCAEWVFNIVPIEKKNTGKIQVCIDFHNLNKATLKMISYAHCRYAY